MSINPNDNVLDIINGVLRVSSIDIKQAGGFTSALNTVARNDVLLYDDQDANTTFIPQQGSLYRSATGVARDTTANAGYIDLNDGWVYWPLQLPNAWHTEFDMHVTTTGGVLTYSLFNTTEPNHTDYTANDGGYKIVFDNTQNQIDIRWQGSVHATTSANIRSTDWQHVNINYFQGAISVSLAGKVVLTHKFTENYQEFDSRYIGFSATSGASHKIRHLTVHNGDKWLYTKTSNASDISYVSGNVGIGTLEPTELLDVYGNVHIAKDLTVDGNLTVSGTTTFIDTQNIAVEDPILELAKGNPSDATDSGFIMTRPTANVAVAYRGDEEELALAYTQSSASGNDVTPIVDGGLDVRVYGNLFANNITTTGNIEALYVKGDGSQLTGIATTLESVSNVGNTTSNTIQFTNVDVGIVATGNIHANYFKGDGSELTGIATTLQSVSDYGNTTSNTVQFTNATTALVADSNVGIGTSVPSANLHVVGYQYVNDPPTQSASFDHSDAPLTLTHSTPTSSTAIDDPKAVLHLTRDGTSGKSYGAKASFKMSRYENSGTASRSRLDVTLADGTYTESNVMSLRGDGKVGVGTTNPGYTLDVAGDINLSGSFYQGGAPFVSSEWTTGTDSLYYRSNVEVGTANLFVDTTTSNVGIGTTTPAYTLDVVGSANVHSINTNSLYLEDFIISSSHGLDHVTNENNSTGDTIISTNATTGFQASSNVVVGGDIHLTGNIYQNGTIFTGGGGSSGSTSVIAPVAFAFVDTTANSTGTGISWGSWNSSNYTLDFTFDTAQSDANYSVITDSETFDDYFVGISNKTTTGFRAEFYDNSQSRTPTTFSPFTFIVYASTPTINVSGGSGGGGGSSLWSESGSDIYYDSGNVGVSNATPAHTLSVGSNLYVDDTGSNVLTVSGNVHVSNVISAQRLKLNNVSVLTNQDIQQVTNVGNVTTNTVEFTNPTTSLVATSNVGIGTNQPAYTLDVRGKFFAEDYDSTVTNTNPISTTSLIAYYDGRDYTSMPTTINDKSGLGANGTPYNGVTFDSTSEAFVFDGVNDYVLSSSLTHSSGDQPFSASVWIKLDPTWNSQGIIWQIKNNATGESNRTPHFAVNATGDFRYDFWGNSLTVASRLNYGQWYHIVGIYKGGGISTQNVEIYFNNVLQSISGGNGNLLNVYQNYNLTLGRSIDNRYYFNGSIANIRLYNRVLTTTEVDDLFKNQSVYFDIGRGGLYFDNGKFGLGTTSPTNTLHVVGTAYFDSPINIAGTSVSSFTGKHICFPEGNMSEGLIVSANKNKYVSLNGSVETGLGAIKSDESLPVVSLSNVSNDRSVFGVIHKIEEEGTKRITNFDGINTEVQKISGDNRVVVNSIGEGAMWVTNINGDLQSGDYITTSNVTGYGQRQDDDILHSYTVAKITMDCDFNPQEVPVQVIKSELDSYGRLQWEDDPSGASEKAYKIRYLTADGQQTDEANCVYRAAYVGCTYHCG